MNKLGFYIENTIVPGLRDAIREVKPPTMLIHAKDRGLLREIRGQLSPDSFVVGRMYVEQQQQAAWLDSADPAAAGRGFAEQILAYDFGLATEKVNGRLLFDAWMSLNEALPGPQTFPGGQPDATWRRRAAAYDDFQLAFRTRLMREGVEAVAFNFAAGNFSRPQDYLDWFPKTLSTYIFLGFHEYGWPGLRPSEVNASAALQYRPCMAGIRERYSTRQRAIITEAGLARMYKYPQGPAGDVGWLYPPDSISQDAYWESLAWYNGEMALNDYVLGCCLFQVGESGQWTTFRHLGQDNQQQPLTIVSRIATLNQAPPPPPPPPPPPTIDLPTLQRRIRELMASLEAAARLLVDYQSLVTRLQTDLSALAVVGAQATTLPQALERLQVRLTRLTAQVVALETQGQISAAQASALRQRISELSGRLAAMRPGAEQAGRLDAQVRQAQSQMPPLNDGAAAAGRVQPQVTTQLAEARRLAAQAGVPPTVREPEQLEDVRGALPAQPQESREVLPVPPASGALEAGDGDAAGFIPLPPPLGAGAGYPTRSEDTITQVIIHHTNTRSDASPQRLAEIDVKRGLPGIRYHFLVDGSGASYWTQPLIAVLPQTNVEEVNRTGVAVALAGNFTEVVPGDAQLRGAAEIVAWLISQLSILPENVRGRSELQPDVLSPGAQWLQGATFKETLMEIVNAILIKSYRTMPE
jgi:hypothetical protein